MAIVCWNEGTEAPLGRFEDKVVMIVGAAGGIGAATARRFAEEGAELALFDVGAGVEQVLADVGGSSGTSGQLDITTLQACQDAVATVIDDHGRLDVLAIIAGVIHDASPVADFPVADWDRVMDVNLKGPFLMSKAAAPHLSRPGAIVTIGSWWGHSGHAYFSAYCASKAGLIVLTQTLADELAEDDVRVNTVCPGNINTSMHRKALEVEASKRGITFEEMKDIEWAKIPLKEAGDPRDIADAIVFLASDEAKYITGASLDVNGGVLYR